MTQSAHKTAVCQATVLRCASRGQYWASSATHSAPLKQDDGNTDENRSKWRLRCTKGTVSSEMSAGDGGVKRHGEK